MLGRADSINRTIDNDRWIIMVWRIPNRIAIIRRRTPDRWMPVWRVMDINRTIITIIVIIPFIIIPIMIVIDIGRIIRMIIIMNDNFLFLGFPVVRFQCMKGGIAS
jgi:hypothetical protein